MIQAVLRRLLQLAPVLLIASAGIWGMIYAVPGSPVGAIVGENATQEQVRDAVARLGLDRPIALQYWSWLEHAARGDLGLSIQSREPVLALVTGRLPATLQLGFAATIVGLLLGVPPALISATWPGSWADRALSGWSALALGVPTFWAGLLLILLFAVQLRWLPSVSAYVPVWEQPVQSLRNLALPALTLGLYVSGVFSRFLRASLLGEMGLDYIRTARSKGLRERQVIGRHAMRNALLPFVTVVGLMAATFIGGSVVTETVFTYPGLGRLLLQAIGVRDYPLIQGCLLVILLIFILMNLLVDLLYLAIDPRTGRQP